MILKMVGRRRADRLGCVIDEQPRQIEQARHPCDHADDMQRLDPRINDEKPGHATISLCDAVIAQRPHPAGQRRLTVADEIGTGLSGDISDQPGETGDKSRMMTDRRHAPIARNIVSFREMTVFDIELDQGLGVLGDEGDRCDHDGHTVPAGADDFGVGRGSDPFQRPDPALIANDAVEAWHRQRFDDRRSALLDLPLIRITSPYDLLRKAVRREQQANAHPGGNILKCLRESARPPSQRIPVPPDSSRAPESVPRGRIALPLYPIR